MVPSGTTSSKCHTYWFQRWRPQHCATKRWWRWVASKVVYNKRSWLQNIGPVIVDEELSTARHGDEGIPCGWRVEDLVSAGHIDEQTERGKVTSADLFFQLASQTSLRFHQMSHVLVSLTGWRCSSESFFKSCMTRCRTSSLHFSPPSGLTTLTLSNIRWRSEDVHLEQSLLLSASRLLDASLSSCWCVFTSCSRQ